jgi:hypothetical protein
MTIRDEQLKERDIFAFKIFERGPMIVATAISAPHRYFYDDDHWNKTWICYAQNRLFELDERPYYNDPSKYEVNYLRALVEYCEIPELDNLMWYWTRQHPELDE